MALIEINGKPVIAATIHLARLGAGTADLIVDAQEAVTGPCLLAIAGGPQLHGFASRTGVWQDTAYVRWVAGAGGLQRTATAKHYRAVTARVVLVDLCRTAGETLSTTSSAAVTGLQLAAWTQVGQPIGRAISALLGDRRLAAPTWRMLPDGTLWVGTETWPDSGLKDVLDVQELARLPHEGKAELGQEAPTLMPGTLLGGRKVSLVEHDVHDGNVRTMAWFED